MQSPKLKLQENSPKFDIIVTSEIEKGKERKTLIYFSILVAKARQRKKYRRGSEHIRLTFQEPVEILYDIWSYINLFSFYGEKGLFKSNQDSTCFELSTLSYYLPMTLTFSIINGNELTELKLEQPKQLTPRLHP